jgi:hypothetical protein
VRTLRRDVQWVRVCVRTCVFICVQIHHIVVRRAPTIPTLVILPSGQGVFRQPQVANTYTP